MKIVKIFGGLGNQMFQYALAVALKVEFPDEELLLDITAYSDKSRHNGFELFRLFDLSISRTASVWQILKLTVFSWSHYRQCLYRKFLPTRATECVEEKCFKYREDVFNVGDRYYDGYWQCPDYFDKHRSEVVCEFRLANPLDGRNNALREVLLADDSSVSVHVRRGDYLDVPLYADTCPKEYYYEALTKARKMIDGPINIYVFSNDIPWAKINMLNLAHADDKIIFVDWNTSKDSYKDMALMSACRANIIANSSFSWWAAYLNNRLDKVVFAPKVWVNSPMDSPIQYKDWILI